MKNNFLLLLMILLSIGFTTNLQAQDELKFADMDKSPMDAAHYPRRAAFQNYLAEDDEDRTQLIKVFYGRPYKKDRVIFGGLVPFGEDWRAGANEATEVTFYRGVEIGGVSIPAGNYTVFVQPYPNNWVIKLSSERFIAGTANRDISQDVVAVTVPVENAGEVREQYTIGFQKVDDDNVNMVFAWDQTMARLPINLNPTFLAGEDASPMDLVAYPPNSRFRNFVEEDEFEASAPQIRVLYSRPQMKGRDIFGGLLEYGEMWRVGANETTEIAFFQDVEIDGTKVEAGRYGLFAVVNKDSWDLIIHSNVQSWGFNNHNDEDNVATINVKTERAPETLEALSMAFVTKSDNMVELVIGWENTMVRMPITVIKE